MATLLGMDDNTRLEIVCEAVRYCQRVAAMGLSVGGYSKTVREAIFFAWSRRLGTKLKSARYCSSAAVGRKFGRNEIRYDHAVPYNYQLKALMSLTDVTRETVRPVLDRFDVCVIITAEEDARLNALGLGSKMPEGWDQTDTLARYKAAGIELVENR